MILSDAFVSKKAWKENRHQNLSAPAHAVREANPFGADGFGEAESAFVLRGCEHEIFRKTTPKPLKTTRKPRKTRFCRKD